MDRPVLEYTVATHCGYFGTCTVVVEVYRLNPHGLQSHLQDVGDELAYPCRGNTCARTGEGEGEGEGGREAKGGRW